MLQPSWDGFLISRSRSIFKPSCSSLSAKHFSLQPIVAVYFIVFLCMNTAGLLPFRFTCSSHIRTTLSARMIFWVGWMVVILRKNPTIFFSHIIPFSSPIMLSPLLGSVEAVGSIIRPITLSIRLIANMTAGHLIISLVSSGLAHNLVRLPCVFSVCFGSLVLFLELFVCVVQAYVFVLLIRIYIEEIC